MDSQKKNELTPEKKDFLSKLKSIRESRLKRSTSYDNLNKRCTKKFEPEPAITKKLKKSYSIVSFEVKVYFKEVELIKSENDEPTCSNITEIFESEEKQINNLKNEVEKLDLN